MKQLFHVTINSFSIYLSSILSIIEACKLLGYKIPRFCYHELLSIAGSCRMCLVELVGSAKPVAACALPISNNINVVINSPLAIKARENIVEVLLLNHPLDCPICDQGGECDLQDQAKKFGKVKTRNINYKKIVENKKFNSLISSIMTRCIHCTRCVRFGVEVLGVEGIGSLLRGEQLEIGNYTKNLKLTSELSANVIDLCPVGALTSKYYSFKARSWEIRSIENIDITDSLGSNIYINYQYNDIIRIIPKSNYNINGSIITNSARYFFDSLKSQRLYRYYTNDNIKVQTEENLLIHIKKKIQYLFLNSISKLIVVNDNLDLCAYAYLKLLSYKYNCAIKNINNKNYKKNYYLLSNNEKIISLNKEHKYIFIIAVNLMIESAIINSYIRNKVNQKNSKVYNLITYCKLNYNSLIININNKYLINFLEGKCKKLSIIMTHHKHSFLLIGDNLENAGFNNINLKWYLKKYFFLINVILIKSKNNSNGCENMFIQNLSKNDLKKKIFLYNLRESLQLSKYFQSNNDMIWFDTHGSSLFFNKAKYICPLLPYYFENNIYINLENRPQKNNKLETNIFSNLIKTKLFFLTIIKNNLILNYLKYYFFSMNFPYIYNLFSNKVINVTYNLTINKINVLPLKSYIEDASMTSKFVMFSKILSTSSLEIRQKIYNFNK
jgi:NADH-quinone oxidoreductase subunit G